MAVSELGWSSLAEAESYFANERLKKAAWKDLADDDEKNTALNMGYNRIYHDPRYAVPVAGDETATQLIVLIKSQSEMAYYIIVHLDDEDRRMGLEAQHVTDAGIVKESYDKDRLDDLPIPPFVDAMLEAAGFTTKKAFGMVDIARDENESVNTKVDDF